MSDELGTPSEPDPDATVPAEPGPADVVRPDAPSDARKPVYVLGVSVFGAGATVLQYLGDAPRGLWVLIIAGGAFVVGAGYLLFKSKRDDVSVVLAVGAAVVGAAMVTVGGLGATGLLRPAPDSDPGLSASRPPAATPAATSTVAASPSASPSPVAPKVFRHGTVQLINYQAVDLDSKADDWDATGDAWKGQDVAYHAEDPAFPDDVVVSRGGKTGQDSVSTVSGSGPWDWQDCGRAPYGEEGKQPAGKAINIGKGFCVLTDEGRTALLVMTGSVPDGIEAEVTVWEAAG